MVVGTILTSIPENPWVSWRRYQAVGHVFSHTAVALTLVGLWPRLLAGWRRPAPIDRRRFATRLAGIVIGLAGTAALLTLLAPRAMHNLLTREWGLAEALQFSAYGVGALICREAARTIRPDHPRRPLYRVGILVLVVLMLEEIDYLGLGAALMSLFGAVRGRIDGTYVGTLHDLLNLAVAHSVLALVPFVVFLALALPWLRRHGPMLLAELRSGTSAPLLPAIVFMALAQADDIFGFPGFRIGGDGPVVAFEEPLELLALVCLNASLILKLNREVVSSST